MEAVMLQHTYDQLRMMPIYSLKAALKLCDMPADNL